MSEPIEFEGMNKVYTKPPSMTDEECGSLPTLVIDNQNISCWRLSPDELAEIKRTGVAWLIVIGRMPPVYVTGTKPFRLESDEIIKLNILGRIKKLCGVFVNWMCSI